jgi:carbonic anhydrase
LKPKLLAGGNPASPRTVLEGFVFDDLIEANRRYREHFHDSGAHGTAKRGLAVLTCIDSRIDPLAMLGLRAGDAKIVRNAGARVTDDALRSLVLATNLLGVTRVCVMQHTDCAVVGATNAELAARIWAERGIDASAWDFLPSTDQISTLQHDVEAIKRCTQVPSEVQVAGFIFDVHTGEIVPVDPLSSEG